MACKDPAAQKAAWRRYYQRNRGKIIAKNAAWAQANRQKKRDANRKYYCSHIEAERAKKARYEKENYARKLERQRAKYHLRKLPKRPPTDTAPVKLIDRRLTATFKKKFGRKPRPSEIQAAADQRSHGQPVK